jgi:hypothetical protein
MSNYTKTTNFTAKDSLISGNPSKIVKGSEHDAEYTAIQTAVNSKADAASPLFTGTPSLNGVAITSTAAELNILDGVTATAAEINVLDGITSTTAELNILDGVTATAAELNALDGITATVTELNYTDGVTSAIQTQLDTKAPLNSPVLVTPNLGTPSAATLTNATGLPIVAGTTGTLSTARGGTGVTTASNGQLLIGNGSGFTAATLTAGSGVSVTNGAGSIAIAFTGSGTGDVTLNGTQTLTNKTLTSPAIGTSIKDTNANTLVAITATGSAVNNFTIANAAAAANPVLSATGSDTNIGINLTPKGTGEVLATSSYLTGVFSDKVTAIGNTGTSQTIACTSGTVYTATLNGDCTFTLSAANSVASRGTSFTLILTNDATPSRTVTLAGAAFKYAGGSIARTTTANAVDIWFFFSPDGGTTFYVSIPMKNVS